MDKLQIDLSPRILLLDAAFLNFLAGDLRAHFVSKLDRSLPPMDMSELVLHLAHTAGWMNEGEKKPAQVLLVYDRHSECLSDFVPYAKVQDFDGKAFDSEWGEFTFFAVPSENLTERSSLFCDLSRIVFNSKEVKSVAMLPFAEEYGDAVEKEIGEYHKASSADGELKKSVVYLGMHQPEEASGFRKELALFPFMMTLGIRSDEL